MVTLRSELKGWEQREYQINKEGLIKCNLSVKKNSLCEECTSCQEKGLLL